MPQGLKVEKLKCFLHLGCTAPRGEDDKSCLVYFNTVKPIIYTLRCMARCFFLTDKGVMYLKWSTLWAVYLSTVYSLSIILGTDNVRGMIEKLENSEKKTEHYLLALNGLMYLIYLYVTPFMALTEWSGIVRYFNKWREFEETYVAYTGSKVNIKLQRPVLLAVLITIPSITALSYLVSSTIIYYGKWYNMLPYIAAFTVYLMYFELWVFTCIAISQVASKLNEHLLEALENPNGWHRAEKLSKYRCLWVMLNDLARTYGSTFGPQMITMMLSNNFSFISALYIVIASLTNQNYDVIEFIQILISSTVMLVIFVEPPHLVANKLHFKFIETILYWDTTHFDTSSSFEIDILLKAISSNPPFMRVWESVTMSRHLWVSITSAVVTYLIVLIQFGTRREP